MQEKPVVFAYAGTAYLPVFYQLNKIFPCTFLVYGDHLHSALKKTGLDCLHLTEGLETEVRDAALQPRMMELLQAYEATRIPRAAPEGTGWPKGWLEGAVDRAEELKRRKIREQILLVEMLDRALERYRPRLAILWEDVLLDGKTFANFFRKRNVPSLHIAHGMGALFHNAHDRIWADRIAVQGERTRRWYLRWGNDPDRIVVTGAPYWDPYARPDSEADRQGARKLLGLPADRKTVLYCSTWTHHLSAHSDPDLVERSFGVFLDAVTEMGGRDLAWVVKPHPSDQMGVGWYDARIKRAGAQDVRVMDPLAHTENLVSAADVLVCVDSIVGVAGVLCGKPVINLPLVRFHDPLFQPHDPVVQAEDGPALARSVDALLNDSTLLGALREKRPRSCYEFNHLNDGRASERVAHLAVSMMDRPAHQARSFRYYDHPREELEPLVPHDAESILDVGCGAGAVGAHIKSRRPWMSVWGVEVVEEVAREAKRKLDGVVVGDIQQGALLEGRRFDCVLLSDVLEHMTDPWTVLENLADRLTERGCIVASVPNVGHWSVVGQLAAGRWPYAEEGILDRDHVRFFTLEEIRRLFRETGWVIEEIQYKFTPTHPLVAPLAELARGMGVEAERAETELKVFQYLLRARPRTQWIGMMLAKGTSYLETGQWSQAENVFRRVTETDPGCARGHLGVAKSQLAQKKLAKVFQTLGRVAGHVMLDSERVCEYLLIMGEAKIQGRKLDEAESHFRAVLALRPGHFPACVGILKCAALSGRTEMAPVNLDALEKDSAGDPARRVEVGALHVLLRDFERAFRIFGDVVTAERNHRGAVIGLASSAQSLEQKRIAVHHLREYLALHPADDELRFLLILFLSEVGAEEDSLSEIRRLLALQPDHAQAKRLLVRVSNEQPRETGHGEQRAMSHEP